MANNGLFGALCVTDFQLTRALSQLMRLLFYTCISFTITFTFRNCTYIQPLPFPNTVHDELVKRTQRFRFFFMSFARWSGIRAGLSHSSHGKTTEQGRVRSYPFHCPDRCERCLLSHNTICAITHKGDTQVSNSPVSSPAEVAPTLTTAKTRYMQT